MPSEPRSTASAYRASKSGDVDTNTALAARDRSTATPAVSLRGSASPGERTMAWRSAGPAAPSSFVLRSNVRSPNGASESSVSDPSGLPASVRSIRPARAPAPPAPIDTRTSALSPLTTARGASMETTAASRCGWWASTMMREPAGRVAAASGSSISPSVTTVIGWPAPSARSTAGRRREDWSRGVVIVSPRRIESPNTNSDSAPTRRAESSAARQSAGPPRVMLSEPSSAAHSGTRLASDAGASSRSATTSATAATRSSALRRAPHPPRSTLEPYWTKPTMRPAASAISHGDMGRKLASALSDGRGCQLPRCQLGDAVQRGVERCEHAVAKLRELGALRGRHGIAARRFECDPRVALLAVDEHLEVEVRPGAQTRAADVCDRFADRHARACMDAGLITAQMAVPRHEAVAMANLEKVAVAVAPRSARHDAIADGAHGRPHGRRVVHSLVLAHAAEDRMLAHDEHARDASKLERRTQERGAHRLAVLIEIVTARRLAREPHGVDQRAGELERRRDHLADAHDTGRRDHPLGNHLEFVADLQIAAHVDAVLVDVGQRPGKLLACTGRQIALRARVDRFVEIRRDGAANGDRVGRPGQPFLGARPAVAGPTQVQQAVGRDLERHFRRRRVGRFGANGDRHPGWNSPGIERCARRGGLHRARHGGGVQTAALEQGSERLAAAEGVEAELPSRHGCLRREDFGGLTIGIGKLWGEAKRGSEEQRNQEIQAEPNEVRLQSICLRMNVGISMSLRSCDGLSGAAGRGARGISGRWVLPMTRAGRLAGNGMTGAPLLGNTTLGCSCAGVPTCNARSKPVAMTVTRISPCIAGSCTAPKMISASSPTASWMISLIWCTSPKVRSAPPVMFTSTPVAPEMLTLSSSGELMACCAASMARFSPRPTPVPMSAEPPACMTVRTSAKSTFTRPVTLMSDEMPCVACNSTSSAFLSASWNGMPLPTTARRRSFGTTIIVSTFLRMSAMPCSAWRMRLRPSNRNGLVTMP